MLMRLNLARLRPQSRNPRRICSLLEPRLQVLQLRMTCAAHRALLHRQAHRLFRKCQLRHAGRLGVPALSRHGVLGERCPPESDARHRHKGFNRYRKSTPSSAECHAHLSMPTFQQHPRWLSQWTFQLDAGQYLALFSRPSPLQTH